MEFIVVWRCGAHYSYIGCNKKASLVIQAELKHKNTLGASNISKQSALIMCVVKTLVGNVIYGNLV